MKKVIAVFLPVFFFTSCTSYIYVERHAEKAVSPPSDPPLTAAGAQRAVALADLLKNKKIAVVYSTNTTRTLKTATPLSDSIKKPITIYAADTTGLFVNKLKTLKSNVLVVGHSNTVLELLDSFHLAHDLHNIPDNGFNNLFIIKTRRCLGTKISLTETTYCAPSQ